MYYKLITYYQTCRYCQGSREIWEKQYHNQLYKVTCPYCTNGKEKLSKYVEAPNFNNLEKNKKRITIQLKNVLKLISDHDKQLYEKAKKIVG